MKIFVGLTLTKEKKRQLKFIIEHKFINKDDRENI